MAELTSTPALTSAVRISADATDALIRSLTETDQMTLGGVWTVRETAVHLITAVNMYAGLAAGSASPIVDRSSLAIFNPGAFYALREDRPAELASLLAAAVDSYCAAVSPLRPDELRPWHYGREVPVAYNIALIANELLMHGTDIALAAGVQWPGDEPAARTTWAVLAPWLTPVRFLPDVAADTRAAVSLCADDCAPLTFRIEGAMTLATEPVELDCTIRGPAMRMLRWYFQRDAWPDAGLTAEGPRSDLAQRLAAFWRPI